MTAVRVVLQVARDTGGFRIAEFLGFMTLGALGDIIVCPEQRKRAQIVVEEYGILPIDFCMAVFALRPQRPIMGVVIEVTGIASGIQCDVEYRFNVAIVAGNNFVTAE